MTDSAHRPEGVLDALSRFFVDDGSLGDTLLWVAELACRESPADIAGITLLVDGDFRTGVVTEPSTLELDRAQYVSGRGPCLDAFRYRQVTRMDSTDGDTPWPEFCHTAAEHGVMSSLSFPVVGQDETLGALNLYSHLPAAFDEKSTAGLETVVAVAAMILTYALVCADARSLSESLKQAVMWQVTVHYAIGILMARTGRTPEESLQILVGESQRANRDLRDVADEIVSLTGRRHDPGGLFLTA